MNNVSQRSIRVIGSDCSPDSATKGSIAASTELLRKQLSKNVESQDGTRIVETQQEDLVGSLDIGRIHFQLRRMKRKSYFSEHVFLTAIPENRSKMLFTFQPQHLQGVPLGEYTATGTLTPGTSAKAAQYMEDGFPGESPSSHGTVTPTDSTSGHSTEGSGGGSAEDVAGFIMFECGLENITLRAAKQTGYDESGVVIEEELPTSPTVAADSPKEESIPHDTGHINETIQQSEIDSLRSSTASQGGNLADDETSFGSPVPPPPPQSSASQDAGKDDISTAALQGDASSFTLEFSGVWFNFAAPPPSPKKKKLEYTKYVDSRPLHITCFLWM